MQAWSQLLKKVIQDSGMSQADISTLLERPKSTISHWVNGERVPPISEVPNLLSKLRLKEITIQKDGNLKMDIEQSYYKKDSYVVDVLNVEASAGTGVINTDLVDSIRSIEFSNVKAKQLFGSIPESSIKVVTVKGDSMSGTIEAGDLVYLDVSKKHYDGDGIYVFVFEGTLFIKRLQKVKDKLLVISDNKHYAQWEISSSETDQLFIQGKVLLSQMLELKRYG
ncbi:S24 family peptidase [Orbaceae bacterium ESL0721]|nr:S24 family peptidase [Orbaceae bacterium ESL0721]